MTFENPIIRYGILIVTAALLQYAVISQFRILGVSADLLLVLAVAAGMRGGADTGAIVGFFCGLLLDCLTVTPFGLGALAYLTAGVCGAGLERATVHSARWLTMTVAALASMAGILVSALVGAIVGDGDLVNGHLVTILLIIALTSSVLVFPVLAACRWADPDEDRIRAATR